MNLNAIAVNTPVAAASQATTADAPQAGIALTSDSLPQDFASQLGAQLGQQHAKTLLSGQSQDKPSLSSILQSKSAKNAPSTSTRLATLQHADAADATASLQKELGKAGLLLSRTTKTSETDRTGETDNLTKKSRADSTPVDDATQLSAADLQSVQSLFAMLAAQNTAVLPTTASPLALVSRTDVSDEQDPLLTEVKSGKLSLGDLLTGLGNRSDIGDEEPKGQTLPSGDAKPAALHHSAATTLDADASVLAKADAQTALAQTAGDKNSVAQHVLSAVNIPASSPLAATTSSALVTAPPTPQLNSQLGSPEWQQALSQQVLMFNRQGQQSAELRLHPQELGALHISLKIEDNQAQLHFASAHGQVRAAIEAAMPHLRHSLAESGIDLSQSSVGSEPSPQWQQAQQQSQQSQQGGGSHSSAGTQPNGAVDIATADALSVPASLQNQINGRQGVDIFA